MVAGGVSLQGNYHEQNQDCFWAFSDENATLLAVSDGLGSCKLSAHGSRAFCDSVRDVLCQDNPIPSDSESICSELHKQWLKHLDGYPIEDCYATGLFAVWRDGVLTMGALGDGFIAAVYNDGETIVLWDDKEDHFINETDCLQEIFEPSYWRVFRSPCNNLNGLIGSSDGMELYPEGEESIVKFLKGFFDSYQGMNSEDINRDITEWLSGWPGTDDKTVAYCL